MSHKDLKNNTKNRLKKSFNNTVDANKQRG